MNIKEKEVLLKIASGLLDEDGEPANTSGGIAKIDAPLKKRIVKRPALELDDDDEVDTEEVKNQPSLRR